MPGPADCPFRQPCAGHANDRAHAWRALSQGVPNTARTAETYMFRALLRLGAGAIGLERPSYTSPPQIKPTVGTDKDPTVSPHGSRATIIVPRELQNRDRVEKMIPRGCSTFADQGRRRAGAERRELARMLGMSDPDARRARELAPGQRLGKEVSLSVVDAQEAQDLGVL
jgi:hypothetical protein